MSLLKSVGRKNYSLVLAFILYHSSFIIPSYAQSPYELKTGRELALFGVGAATGATALVLEERVMPLSAGEIAGLNRADINAIDRQATYQFSSSADRLSDITFVGNVAVLGLLTIGTKPMRHDLKTLGIMYLETMLLVNGVQRSVKNFVQRTRPFVYNPDAPLDEKMERDARKSFFSGHGTNAFATAVFTGEVFRHYFPHSRLKSVVWIGSLGLATATSVLRYEAGKHYPTDLLAGAAFGSLVGWGIPKLHEVKNRSEIGRRMDVQPWSNGSANGIYMRLAVFSR